MAGRRQSMRKGLDPKDEEMRIVNSSNLNKFEVDDLRENFKKVESSKSATGGTITKYELFEVLKLSGYNLTERVKNFINEDIEKRRTRKLDFIAALEIAGVVKDIEQKEQEENDTNYEYLDTFVAMGGGPGIDGSVKKQKIIDIIKNEFELTFDVEELLDEINQGNDDLDFKSFCQLFETAAEDSKSGISRQSFLSAISERLRRSSTNFKPKYKDFLKFCEKMDNAELK